MNIFNEFNLTIGAISHDIKVFKNDFADKWFISKYVCMCVGGVAADRSPLDIMNYIGIRTQRILVQGPISQYKHYMKVQRYLKDVSLGVAF